jgi:hypothetical protein
LFIASAHRAWAMTPSPNLGTTIQTEQRMKKQDYLTLITDFYNAVGIKNEKPDDMANHVDIEGHTVGVLFDENQAPDTLFIYVDLGAASLDIEPKLLWANAAMPSQADGLGCFCKWKDSGSVVYRTHLHTGTPIKGADLANAVVRMVAVAKTHLQLATQ